jgi:phosphoribosyl 1,2-cyclic phosphodiesterase
MRCTILASGSKGNCTVIEGESGAILIDAGLSTKDLLHRLSRTECPPEAICAVLVTHEHGDHIRGLDVLARRLEIPVFATGGTLADFIAHRRTSSAPLDTHVCHLLEHFSVGDFDVLPFSTSHDAAEPCGFVVRENGVRMGYCTDTGVVTPHMLALLRRCDGLILESNHCPEMLEKGPYPEPLKRRIRSKRGHLSNAAARDSLRALGADVPQVILAHLSEINNTPERVRASAREGFGLYYGEKTIIVATQEGNCPGSEQQIVL